MYNIILKIKLSLKENNLKITKKHTRMCVYVRL